MQLDIASYVTSAAVSPTGTYMAFGDADGAIHLLSQEQGGSELPLNGFDGQPIELANTTSPTPEIEWNDDTYVYIATFQTSTNLVAPGR